MKNNQHPLCLPVMFLFLAPPGVTDVAVQKAAEAHEQHVYSERTFARFADAVNWLETTHNLGVTVIAEIGPREEDLQALLDLPFETAFFQLGDTQKWIIVKGQRLIKDGLEAEVEVPAAVERAASCYHVHPRAIRDWPTILPSFEDVRLAARLEGNSFLVSASGITRFTGWDPHVVAGLHASVPARSVTLTVHREKPGQPLAEETFHFVNGGAETLQDEFSAFLRRDRDVEHPRSMNPALHSADIVRIYLRFYARVGAHIQLVPWDTLNGRPLSAISWNSVPELKDIPVASVVLPRFELPPADKNAAFEPAGPPSEEIIAVIDTFIRSSLAAMGDKSKRQHFMNDSRKIAVLVRLGELLEQTNLTTFSGSFRSWQRSIFCRWLQCVHSQALLVAEEELFQYAALHGQRNFLKAHVLRTVRLNLRRGVDAGAIVDEALGIPGVKTTEFLQDLGTMVFPLESLEMEEILIALSGRIAADLQATGEYVPESWMPGTPPFYAIKNSRANLAGDTSL